MKKKSKRWIASIVGIVFLSCGVYAYILYASISHTLDGVYHPLQRDQNADNAGNTSVPISILLLGADARQDEQGRSDSIILMTLNPKKNSMKTLSIPRDTYTEIVGKGKQDKINHAYAFGGMNMAVATVEKFLNIPIHYYIEVNMEGFKGIVDAVGGIDVENDLAFTLEGNTFIKGAIHLNGEEALGFTRMRKEDPRGDFGRQMRQRQVLQAVIKKGTSFSSLANYSEMLAAIQHNVKTNVTKGQMLKIQQTYKSSLENSEEIQISGDGHKAADGIWYYYVPDHVKQDITNELQSHLELHT
ncbi:polyisoprenyl-teichoic acid--peptidoglycan teichoic acid transferase TagU [Bacillus wiedmannii]|uniref:polyisoprenyl-teichoic acid--peptidoglycan teichoic acid transferase TagU n=1 Tax=Bacillus wiedmannii TaxID=1890302 RepID=UPI000BEF4B96|nr:LytR family transcriptional regulator [Bacillus wiedmannii]PEO39963.1 LytR family transcriptional regulator [Bacillus wiedmannii]